MKLIMSAFLVLGFGLGALAEVPDAGETRSKAVRESLEAFSGTWEIITVQPPGATKEAKRLVFRNDQTYAAVDATGKELWAGTFDLDPTVTPKLWDHRSNESQKTGGDALGIYELDGDSLKVGCVVGTWKGKQWTGKSRPTELRLPSADAVLELRRVKPGT